MTIIRVAIVGLGKIARDQHIPAISDTAGIELVAIASRNASIDGIAHFATLNELLADATNIDAVALCTPPQVRRAQAQAALKAGKHARILPRPFFLTRAELSFPRNRAAPIAADLVFSDDEGLPIRAEFDWRQTGPQTWDIRIETDAGRLTLLSGGSRLVHDDRTLVDENQAEYRGIYRRFVELIANGVPMSISRRWSMSPMPSCSAGRGVEPFVEG